MLFFIFTKFWFSGLLVGGRVVKGKKWLKMTKNSVSLRILGASYDCGFWHKFVKWWYLQQFFLFFRNSNFLGFSKFISKCLKEILRCPSPSLHVCDFFSPFFYQHKIPNFCFWFLWKAPWTDQRSEMVSFCKITRLSSKETLLKA